MSRYVRLKGGIYQMLSLVNLNSKAMGFDLKDLLEKQAYYRKKMGVPMLDVMGALKDDNLTIEDQEKLRVRVQKTLYSNETEYDNG